MFDLKPLIVMYCYGSPIYSVPVQKCILCRNGKGSETNFMISPFVAKEAGET